MNSGERRQMMSKYAEGKSLELDHGDWRERSTERPQRLMDVVELIEVSSDSFSLLREIGNKVICAERWGRGRWRFEEKEDGNRPSGKQDDAVGLPVRTKGHWHKERMNASGLDEDTREWVRQGRAQG